MRPPAAAAPAAPRAELLRPGQHRHHPPPRPSPPGQHRAAARRPQPPGRQPGLDTLCRTSYRHHRGAHLRHPSGGLPRNHGKRNGEGRCHSRHGHGNAVQQPPHPEPAEPHLNDTVNGGTPLPRGHPQRRVTPLGGGSVPRGGSRRDARGCRRSLAACTAGECRAAPILREVHRDRGMYGCHRVSAEEVPGGSSRAVSTAAAVVPPRPGRDPAGVTGVTAWPGFSVCHPLGDTRRHDFVQR